MPFRKRRTRVTIGKDPRRMSRTNIQTLIAGTVDQVSTINSTIDAGVSGSGDVYENADTELQCSPNEIIKYINIRVQYSVKPGTAPAAPGWIEYAVVFFNEQQNAPALDGGIQSNFGIQTVGDTCINLYRGKCIWNGAIRVSKELPEVLDLKIKIPQRYCKMVRGSYWRFIHAFRSNDSTDSTTAIRSVYSHQFKVYA